ncbi:glycosyltransferase [Kiloniella majae]|uniref:glycosyltransferase n=1 Tax=Kiloniella majae TaxID=1938558 RepID=UPI000A27811E|nr:glycosyltransferase [Kiloniella majae]
MSQKVLKETYRPRQPMKILHIIAGASIGGAETFCKDTIEALAQQNINQHVICRSHPRLLKILVENNVSYTPLSFNRFRKWSERNRIKRIIAKEEPTIIHSWMSRASSFVPQELNVPVIGWFGGYYDLKNYRNCNYYMAVTRDIVKHIHQQSGKQHNTFLVHTFGTLSEDKPLNKADLGIPEGKKVVLLLSRMHWKKGVDTLLNAAVKLPDSYFLLAGSGPELERYKKLAVSLKIEDRIRFLGWRDDRSALLALADVCVLPSRYEPFGTVIAEAWFAGVPLVATKAQGAVQYVTHNHDGLLCEIDDVSSLSGLLHQAQTDKKLREKLACNGAKTYQQTFSKELVISKMLEAYCQVIHDFKFNVLR